MAYVALIVVIFGAELLMKQLVEQFVRLGEKRELLQNHVFLTKYHNEGAALNFMAKRRGLVAVCSVVLSAACTLLFAVTMTRVGKDFLKLSLSFLLGGAYSNTYDRLRRKYVVDYLGFSHGKRGKPDVIYNLSDFCIILGALGVALSAFE
ncbi:MAG: signal peptidase II [Lachnospiraceae bacterium]|nr:signal peptidase II [Lachnospiraceae bacterium]